MPEELTYEQRREIWRDEMLRRGDINSRGTATFTAMHRSVIDFALAAIRGGILLNGGGAVAILSFMAASEKLRSADLLYGLLLFVVGAVLAAFTASISYISQDCFIAEAVYRWRNELKPNPDKLKSAKKIQSVANGFKYAGCSTMALAYILFILGCFSTHGALKSITNGG